MLYLIKIEDYFNDNHTKLCLLCMIICKSAFKSYIKVRPAEGITALRLKPTEGFD